MTAKKQPRITISWWLWIMEKILIRNVKVTEEWLSKVRTAAKTGPVIFVLRNRNLIDFLCVRGICKRYNLPTLGFVSGISPVTFLPFWKFLIALFGPKHDQKQKQRLTRTLDAGGCGVVFLRRPALRDALGSRPVALDGIRLATEVQEELDTPVAVLPTVFLWGENPMKRAKGSLSFLFGTSEYPRLIRSIWLLLRRRSVHGLWSGPCMDICELRKERGDNPDRLAGVVRAYVGKQIELIRRQRLGSFTKPSARVKAEVVKSPRLRSELAPIVENENIQQNEIAPRIRTIVEQLATDFKPRVLAAFAIIMAFLWKRLYTSFDIRTQDLERIRAAVGKGPLMLLPCHKSHIDYLAVSQAMSSANIMLPHIAAGDNLSFWPMGPVFRACGAFFIRRRFVNDKFYATVVNAYIRRLIQEGYAIEVFIEGGRSRTGKLLRPKLGMLEMALNAMATIPGKNPGVLPTFIGYENVIEEGAYLKESQGGKKKSESISGLLKTSKVLLKKYGTLYVRTGDFFTVKDVLEQLGYTTDQLSQGSIRRAVALEIGMRTLHNIQEYSVATALSVISLALLSSPQNRIRQKELQESVLWLTRFLDRRKVNLSDTLQQWTNNDQISILNELLSLSKEGRIHLTEKSQNGDIELKNNQRAALEFYKNNIIHFFVPASLLAVHCQKSKDTNITRESMQQAMGLAAKLYRWEFLLPEYKPTKEDQFQEKIAEITEQGITALLDMNVLKKEDSAYIVSDEDGLVLLVNQLRSFHETYHCALDVTRRRVLGEINGDPTKTARKLFEQRLKDGRYIKPEGQNRIVFQTAFGALKDLKLNRPAKDERPFDDGQTGSELLAYLESAFQ